jgi:mRNA interferase RelE/StbE
MYTVEFAPSVDRALRRLPEAVQRRIVRAVEALSHDPRHTGSVKLSGEDNLWRIRVGQYRVIYTIHDDRLAVLVVRVAHRKDAYRGM